MHNNFLLVKELKADEKDEKSGIFLSVEKDDEFQTSRCEVLLVSEGSKFKPKDIIYFSKLVPDDVMLKDGKEDVKLWFVREDDIKMSYGK